jgi:hypothetical protein
MADHDPARHSGFPRRVEGLIALRSAAVARAVELRALETARQWVETRYLGGHQSLFPATGRTWAGQRERTDGLATIAVQLAELESLAPMPADDPATFEARVAELMADHVEPARVKAYDDLGEGRRAVSVAMAWLERRLG